MYNFGMSLWFACFLLEKFNLPDLQFYQQESNRPTSTNTSNICSWSRLLLYLGCRGRERKGTHTTDRRGETLWSLQSKKTRTGDFGQSISERCKFPRILVVRLKKFNGIILCKNQNFYCKHQNCHHNLMSNGNLRLYYILFKKKMHWKRRKKYVILSEKLYSWTELVILKGTWILSIKLFCRKIRFGLQNVLTKKNASNTNFQKSSISNQKHVSN